MSKFAGLGIAVEQPSRLTLISPFNGQPLRNSETNEEAWIELLSVSSHAAKAHDRAVLDKNIKRGGRRITAEEIEADEIEKFAKLTKGWSLVTPEGAPLDVEFSPANARELYSMAEASWIVDQVRGFVLDLGNFRQPASTS